MKDAKKTTLEKQKEYKYIESKIMQEKIQHQVFDNTKNLQATRWIIRMLKYGTIPAMI